jgi:hypothetical protein
MTTRDIVQHPTSGDRYILETTRTPDGMVYRAAGPLHHEEHPTDDEMVAWLNNQPDEDAYGDGAWLAAELARTS